MTYKNDLIGREFDWFAVDRDGNVGLFSSAGQGFIPVSVLSNFKEHDVISNSIDTPNWGSLQIWSDYSEMGLYVYDWKHNGGPYNRVRNPAKEIEKDLRDALDSLVCLNLVFANSPEIEERQITMC